MAATEKYRKHGCGIIRVLYVNLEGSIAGAEQSLLLFVRFVSKTVKISVACPSGGLSEKLINLGVRTYQIFPPPRKFNIPVVQLFYLTAVNIRLLLIVLKARPQIIHANGTKAVLATALARIFVCKKLIWHMRDLRCSRLQAGISYCLSSKIIAVSKAVENKLTELKIKPQLIEVIYNGIDTGSIKPRQKNQNSPFIFANIGQFVPWKKQTTFVKAAEEFLREGSSAGFVLIGDDIFARNGRYKNELVNRVKMSPFSKNIKIISWQDGLDPFWSKIDCLVHTAHAEPFGRVIIEAMSNGVFVIAAADGGPSEIISDGNTGFVFVPDDIDGLIKAMKTVSGDRDLTQTLAENGRKHVISNFRAKRTAEKITKIYDELTAA